MLIKKFAPILILLVSVVYCFAQDPSQTATTQSTPDPGQQQEEKLKLERKATALLEQVVTEAQGMKLPENRVRVQITAADMLWYRSQARARGLFSDAATVLGQMALDADRTDREEVQSLNQLRQELVLTAARHDSDLAYQMLRSTQSLTANNAGNGRRFPVDPQSNLEQNLLAAIAASDPKVAYQKANESLDKDEYPTALARVLAQLQAKDPEAFKKLSDKTLSRLGSDSLLASREATSLAMSLLMPGPRVSASPSADANKSAANTAQVLNESAYHDLMDNAVTAALNVTSLGPGNMNRGGGGRGPFRAAQQNPQTTASQNTPDDTEVRQNNARMLLFGLSTMLPQIDQYLPERAPALRQKLTDLGMGNNAMMNNGNQMRTAMQQGTSDSLEAAAKVAPPQIQSRLYQ